MDVQDDSLRFEVSGKGPRWARTAWVMRSSGDIYMPAAAAGNETTVFLCAGFDNEPILRVHRHVYVRTSWVRREFPKCADIADLIERKIKGSQTNATAGI
jgi:hypothetical protein